MATTILDWLVAHQAYLWLALALACNIVRRLRTDEQIVAAAERTRAGAAIALTLRVLGLDPIGVVQIVATLLNAKAAAEAARGQIPLPPDALKSGLPPGGSAIEGAGGAEGSDPRGGGP